MNNLNKEYRTDEQYETIFENCYNGNWSDAAQNCVDYGFYANDLINKEKEFDLFEDKTDLAILTEMASELRNK